jgi:hypothetical protein
MIIIERVNTQVRVKIENGPLGHWYAFSFECNDDCYADLLRQHFQSALWNRIEAIRKQEYEEGYKAGRSKKEKKKYFYTSMKLS